MAYSNKLDTDVVTITTIGGFGYSTSSGTIDLDAVIAYHTFVKPDGTASSYTILITDGMPVIVDETYATIDGLINP